MLQMGSSRCPNPYGASDGQNGLSRGSLPLAGSTTARSAAISAPPPAAGWSRPFLDATLNAGHNQWPRNDELPPPTLPGPTVQLEPVAASTPPPGAIQQPPQAILAPPLGGPTRTSLVITAVSAGSGTPPLLGFDGQSVCALNFLPPGAVHVPHMDPTSSAAEHKTFYAIYLPHPWEVAVKEYLKNIMSMVCCKNSSFYQ